MHQKGFSQLQLEIARVQARIPHDGAHAVALVKQGTGTLTLSHADTYSGGTTIDAGTLDLETTNAAGTGTITFAPGSAAAAVRKASPI